MTEEEIMNVWYSMGFRGGTSANDWSVRIKFARAIEQYVKDKCERK